ncbi:hypothetical protein BOTBODRAFT_34524 [Botryobasidium botryosum FD-172 SS1]|uniref:FAS1 domain-containing protein n=1 Tax=Botryobasidium botryosum (strain FD-172 SS1) TaxID=930990 RepID=A0A067MKZ6_BOTB1|nr:hypothetical protein BOTBODRAFT_34524 [Botryobasidium botryosum FD-172 SS1]
MISIKAIVSALFLVVPVVSARLVMPLPKQQAPFDQFSSGPPTLVELLTVQSSSSIFYDYLREIPQFSERIADRSVNTTLFVPSNKAVVALPRKPNQGPNLEGNINISEQEFDERSKLNVQRWVGAHIVPAAVSLSSGESYPTLHDDVFVKFKKVSSAHPEWKGYVVEPDTAIIGALEASNGVVYLIDGTITS